MGVGKAENGGGALFPAERIISQVQIHLFFNLKRLETEGFHDIRPG